MYMTEPVAGLGGRRSYWTRGKVLGGSSSINAMVYIRGQAEDYEGWKAAGNPGWGWDEILPLYRRVEFHEGGPSAHHGGSRSVERRVGKWWVRNGRSRSAPSQSKTK